MRDQLPFSVGPPLATEFRRRGGTARNAPTIIPPEQNAPKRFYGPVVPRAPLAVLTERIFYFLICSIRPNESWPDCTHWPDCAKFPNGIWQHTLACLHRLARFHLQRRRIFARIVPLRTAVSPPRRLKGRSGVQNHHRNMNHQ
jgi:hypothetical protein